MQFKVIEFAPIQIINFIHDRRIYILLIYNIVKIVWMELWMEKFHSHYLNLTDRQYWKNEIGFFLLYDLNESHIHPGTRSSALRASPKSWGFCDVSNWLSCVSNKLFHSWHGELYIYLYIMSGFRSILTRGFWIIYILLILNYFYPINLIS